MEEPPEFKYCLSFDCADKTLGVCLIGFMNAADILNNFGICQDAGSKESPIKFFTNNGIFNNVVFVRECWLFNLLPETKVRGTDDSLRLGRLKTALSSIKKTLDEMKISIAELHIEYQMGDLCRLISAAIIYEFTASDKNIETIIGPKIDVPEIAGPKIVVVMPACKNSIEICDELGYRVFIERPTTRTTANKHHTAENFKYFLRMQDTRSTYKKISLGKCKHSEINHIADAFMQSMYILCQHHWLSVPINGR